MTGGGGSSESYTSHRESITSQSSPVVQQTIVYPSGSSGYTKHFSEKVTSSGSSAPVVTYTVPSGGVERYTHSRFSETSGGGGGGGIVPLASFPISSGGSSFSSSRHNERVSQAVPAVVPVSIFPSGGSTSRYSNSQVSLTVHFPSVQKKSKHITTIFTVDFFCQFKEVSQATPTVVTFSTYPSSGGGSVHTESRFSEIKSTPVAPLIIPVSTGGGSQRSSSFRESHSSHAAPQIVYTAPIIPSGGSSYSRHESYTNQGSGGQIVPIVSYPSGSSSSNFREESSSSSGGGYGGAHIVSYPSGSSSSSRFREESSSSGGGFGGGVVSYPSIGSGSHLSSRFSDYHDSSFGGASDLGRYMTESERLARERLHSSSGFNSINAVDFGHGQLTPSTGSQSKSWEKSSKWSSQSEVS